MVANVQVVVVAAVVGVLFQDTRTTILDIGIAAQGGAGGAFASCFFEPSCGCCCCFPSPSDQYMTCTVRSKSLPAIWLVPSS